MSTITSDVEAQAWKKRKLVTTNNHIDNAENVYPACIQPHILPGRKFLHLHKGNKIFETENWQPTGSTLFCPLKDDLIVNTSNIEQFSCARGSFFVAGTNGQYAETLTGDVLHLWRFCKQTKKLYISRSFLFRNAQDFGEVQQTLLCL